MIKIAIIGLGYVGLPLARLFATKYPVVGFDINRKRVEELMKGIDHTLEVEEDFRPDGNRYECRAGSLRHQMELSAFQARSGGRTLHWCRSLLSGAESAGIRLGLLDGIAGQEV